MKQFGAGLQHSLKGFLSGTIVGFLLVVALYLNLCPSERLRLNDLLYPSSSAEAPVAIVLIDEEAVHRYGRPETWSADLYQTLFLALQGAGAQVIALTFPVPSQAEAALASLPDAKNIVLPVLGAGNPRTGNGRLVYPYLVGPEPGRFSIGHLNLIPDADGVLRRLPLWVSGPGYTVPALAWRAAALYLGTSIPLPTANGALQWAGHSITQDAAGRVLIYFSSSPIPIRQLTDLQDPGFPPNALAGRIVFVGISPEENQDTYRTPVGEMSAVQIQARAAAALMLGLTLTPLPAVTALLTFVASTLSGWMVARLYAPVRILVGLLGLAPGTVLICYLLYQNGLQVDLLVPLAGILTSALVAALWRSREYHLRRERLLRSLQGRLSSGLLDRLLTDPRSEQLLAPNIRFVAVLFADIRGFVRLTEGQDPRKIQETANAHLAQFTQAVVDAEGIVIKYIGDMIAAVFNAPLPIAQPTDQALCAALDGLRRLRDLWSRNPEMVRMQMGVGIHVGPAVVGLLGPAERQEYDAIGDTVNVAARLSTYAPAGEIYVTEAVVATAGKEWVFEPVGTLRLRGRYEPVIVYRLKETPFPPTGIRRVFTSSLLPRG
ncbi:MAG: adenylate/guanylate cyclase domain-containing protein [Anaerolineae bacterium]|nr:adenylate/guanylate cyclase domain-containing protein [Anaerolineae bacterium]MCX8066705.1 adenylate/guanylate cyclase domain-containing protein [Anaerolineae bacterium]